MKNITLVALIFAFILVSVDADAQRKRRTTGTESNREKPEKVEFKDKLNPEIKIGTIGGGSNGFYSVFTLSLKGNVGYKLNKTFSAGLGAKGFYEYVNYSNSSESDNYFSYGPFAYLRAQFKEFYLQGEYHTTRFAGYGLNPSENIAYPVIGAGYLSNSGSKWSFGPEFNFILKDEAIDRNGILEYWINISYNF